MLALPRVRLIAALAWFGVALAVVLADQASKAYYLALLEPARPLAVTGYFNLALAFNRGASFSLLDGSGGWQSPLFTAIGLAASAFLAWMIARHAPPPRLALALSLILGGALGNVADRLRLGHVVDFLDFHWRGLEYVSVTLFPGGHFPAFNLADSAICAGAALLIVDEVLRARKRI